MLMNHLYIAERMAWMTPSDAVKVLVRPEDLEPTEVGCTTMKTSKTLSRPRSVKDSFSTSSSLINAVLGGHHAISESDTHLCVFDD